MGLSLSHQRVLVKVEQALTGFDRSIEHGKRPPLDPPAAVPMSVTSAGGTVRAIT
jgi:hypothetical protein